MNQYILAWTSKYQPKPVRDKSFSEVQNTSEHKQEILTALPRD